MGGVNQTKCLCIVILSLGLCADELAGQLYRFGKNKVQYDEFEWRKMDTPHFDVYFYPQEEELATYAARMAEEGFSDLEKRFAHTVRRRVPLIVYSSHVYFEQTNIIPGLLPEGVAGFTEFLKGRVALPLSGSMPDFERVLHHELVHVFMFDRIRAVLRSRHISQFRPSPLWFSEGLAEYWSSDWESVGGMIMRDAVFSGQLVPIESMYRINGTFLLYKEGQSICEFMASRYGEDVFARLLDNWWRSEQFSEVFAITTGETLSDLDEHWQYHVRKAFLPDIAESDPPSQMAKSLTTEGYNLKPELVAPTATGKLGDIALDSLDVIFFRNDQGYTYIARQSLAAGGPQTIVEGERSASYESLHPMVSSLAVSDDGRWLAFSAKRGGRDHLHIWDLRPEDGRARERSSLSFDSIVSISSPSWSPNGRRILFSGAGASGQTNLYTADVETGALQTLTDDIYHDKDPDWDPAGNWIAFSSDRWLGGRRGYYNLFLYELEGGRIVQLTRGEHNDLQPSWSPSGERIAFSSDRARIYDLYAVALTEADEGVAPTAAALHRLSHTLTGVFDPTWLPDESGLLFTGYEAGRFNIYRLDFPAQNGGEGAADSSVVALAPVEVDEADSWRLTGFDRGSPLTQRRYKRQLTLDIAQSQISQDPVFGTSGGIQIGLSDLLGNEQYYFVLSHISGSDVGLLNGLNFAFGRMHLARQLNVIWGGFRLNDRFSRFGRFVREKRVGGYVELSYPFSRHTRVETRMSVRHSDIDRRIEGRELKGWLVSNYLSYTHDNSLWIPTGPLEGRRYSIGVGQSVDFKSSRRFNVTLFGDYRQYLRLSRRSGFAVRYMGRHSRGDVPEFFSIGGSWTLRGYGWRTIWGRNLVLANHELRFPLLDRLVFAFPFGNIDISAFRGAVFVDAGNAWSDTFGDWNGAIGAGTRLAIGGGVFVFRLDASRRTDFASIGNDTHWDFFFGWDF